MRTRPRCSQTTAERMRARHAHGSRCGVLLQRSSAPRLLTPCSFVPESLLKKRKHNDALRTKVMALRKVEKAAAKTKRATIFKRAESYVAEYAKEQKSLVEARRAARAKGDYFVDPQAKLAVVMRIRGINGVSPKVRKILQLLRLRQIFNASFVKLNKATLQMLQLVKPYIAWG